MEGALIDNSAIHGFAGIDLAKDNIPDATTILAFRHVVEQHQLAEEIFKTVEQYLEEKGLLLRKGTIVDATIIHAPTSTKNEKRDREPQMHQTHKGNQWFFGMKVQIGVDKDSGLIHSVATTAAHVSDVVVAVELLHGEEKGSMGMPGTKGNAGKPRFKAIIRRRKLNYVIDRAFSGSKGLILLLNGLHGS